uniref:Voltage-dependent L-type calcium channel subunit alpha n=1 Tax=Globodera pallida TaxID=36090 RepID=A0A183BN55_GLOPA
MYSDGGSGELRASGSASSFHIYASNNNDDAVEFNNDGDRTVSELVQENGTGAGAVLLRSNFDSCGSMNTRHSNGIGIPFTSNGTGALQQQYNRHNNYKTNNPGTNDYNNRVNNINIGNTNNCIGLHGGTPAPQLPAQQLQLQQHNYNHHHLPRKHSSSSLADQRLIVDRENVELTFHHGSTVSLYSGTGVRSSSLVPVGNAHRMMPLTARAKHRKQHIMLDNTEEVSSTQNGFFRNPSQPLKQTRGTCSRLPQRKQQWTARSMVGVYTDEEDEEEGDMEEDDDDDDGDGEVSNGDQRNGYNVVSYKEARKQLDELKQQNGDAKAMTSSACAERTNLLPSATKCQSNSDVNLSTQKGTNMASVQHHKQQHHIESSRSTSAQNVTRKASLSDHQPPQQLSAQIAAGATNAINGMAPVVNKLSAQLKKRPYNPIGAAVTLEDECNGGTLLNGHSTTEAQNANNGQHEANNANANGQQEANNGQQEANNANANGQQEANNANASNGQQEANNANANGQQEANNANANNGQQEANNAISNGQHEANNANANGQQEANNANANNEQQQQQMGIQQISKNNEGNNNMPAMEEAKARQSVDQTVFDTDICKTRRTARTRCDSL